MPIKEKIKQFIAFYLLLPLLKKCVDLRLYLLKRCAFLYHKRFSKTLKLYPLINTIVMYFAKIADDSYTLMGENEKEDDNYYIAMCKLFESNSQHSKRVNDDIKFSTIYCNNKNRIDSIIAKTKEKFDQQITGCILDFKKLDDLHNKFLQVYGKDHPIFEITKANEISVELRKLSKSLKKKYQKKYKEIRELIITLKSEDKKFNFENVNFNLIIALVPLLALFGGYVHEKFLLFLFSIKADDYFSVSDYISSSFSQLTHVVIIIGIAMFIAHVLEIQRARAHKIIIEKSDDFLRKVWWICFFLVIFTSFVSDSIVWFVGNLTILIILPLFLRRYVSIKQIRKIHSIFVAITLCLTYITTSAYTEAVYIKNHKNENSEKFYIKPKLLPREFNFDKLTKITANSRYYFLYDTRGKKAIILPIDDIKYVSSNENKIDKFSVLFGKTTISVFSDMIKKIKTSGNN